MVVSPEQMLVGMGLIVASQVNMHLCTSHLANPLFSPLHSLQLSLDRCKSNIRAGQSLNQRCVYGTKLSSLLYSPIIKNAWQGEL